MYKVQSVDSRSILLYIYIYIYIYLYIYICEYVQECSIVELKRRITREKISSATRVTSSFYIYKFLAEIVKHETQSSKIVLDFLSCYSINIYLYINI